VDGLGEGVADAAVYLLPEGETDPEKSLTSTVTEPTGHYVLLGIDPGTYDLRVEKDLLSGSQGGVAVMEGSITFIDLTAE
jgi:hypothetical protein